jgi:hypothetical protein
MPIAESMSLNEKPTILKHLNKRQIKQVAIGARSFLCTGEDIMAPDTSIKLSDRRKATND